MQLLGASCSLDVGDRNVAAYAHQQTFGDLWEKHFAVHHQEVVSSGKVLIGQLIGRETVRRRVTMAPFEL